MKNLLNSILTIIIAAVWITNGLYCKILNQVSRHEAIVAKVLNTEYSRILIVIIGVLEVFMAVWILSKYKQKLNAIVQIAIVLTMNIIEFIKASELLLWNKLNIIFALFFIVIVFLNSFHFNKKENNVINT